MGKEMNRQMVNLNKIEHRTVHLYSEIILKSVCGYMYCIQLTRNECGFSCASEQFNFIACHLVFFQRNFRMEILPQTERKSEWICSKEHNALSFEWIVVQKMEYIKSNSVTKICVYCCNIIRISVYHWPRFVSNILNINL